MKKTTNLAIALSLFMVVLLITGCTITGRAVQEVTAEQPIKVGVIAPLTGDAGIYGDDISQAIELAQKTYQQPVKIYYEDACLAKDALKSIQKLVLADKVDLVTGLFCIPSIQPAMSKMNPEKITGTVTATVPDSVLEAEGYIFSPNAAIKDEAKAQAEYAYHELGARKVSLVWLNSDFGLSYSTHFAKTFTALGGEMVTNEAVEFFGSDYRTDLTKVKEKNPDLLVSIHFGNQMALIVKQAREIGITVPIMGTYESEDQMILDFAGNAAEGLIFSSPIGKGLGPEHYAFTEAYKEAYGKEPTLIATMAYDGFKMQVDAHLTCDGDKDCIIDNLQNIKDYSGASGKFDIGPDGTAQRDFVFKKVVDGKFVRID